MTLGILDSQGFPPDPELRRLVVGLNLSTEDTYALAEGFRRAVAAALAAHDPRAGQSKFWRDGELLTRLEAALDRDLTRKDCQSVAHEAEGDAKLRTKGDRLWKLYQERLEERQATDFALGLPKSG